MDQSTRGVAGSLPKTVGRRTFGLLLLLLVFVSLSNVGCSESPKSKLLIIGLDGATWDLVEPWVESGDLPNLKALRDQSAWGTMRSVIPYLSPPAWTSAATGVNPGRHGIFDFQRRIPGDNKVVTETAKSRRSPPIWNMLRGSGRKVAVINVPMSDPPDEVDGVMVAGFPHLDEEGYTYPREMEERLESMGYLLDHMEMKIPDGEEEAVFQELWDTLQKRWALVRELYTEDIYDLFWVVFTGTDRVQHLFWQFDDPQSPKYDEERAARLGGSMKRLWVEQDRILGELLAMIPEDTWVLLVSDHGFAPIHRELRLGNYLRATDSGFTEDEAREVFALDKSDAARVFIREPGRDPGGHLSPAEREALEGRLAEYLAEATDPETGQEAIEAVYPKRQVFVGKYAERGPTLTLMPAYSWHVTLGDHSDGYQLPPFGTLSSGLSGWHRMEGVFLLRGPGVQPGHVDQVYNLLDVVPTSLYMMGETMAEDLDGEIMESCFTSDYLSGNKPKREGLLSEEDRPMTPEEEAALKNLPYIGG